MNTYKQCIYITYEYRNPKITWVMGSSLVQGKNLREGDDLPPVLSKPFLCTLVQTTSRRRE